MIGFIKPVENPAPNELVKQLLHSWKVIKQQNKGLKRQARKITALRNKIRSLEVDLCANECEKSYE